MKKRDKIYDSPEYKEIKEHLPEILEELENAKKSKEYQIPEEWNKDFKRIYRNERRKERICKTLMAAACCAAVLGAGIIFAGGNLEGGSVVQADDMKKTKKIGFEQGKYQYSLQSNVDQEEYFSEDEDDYTFVNTDPSKVYNEMKEKIRTPFFWIEKIPTNYSVEEAEYSRLHRSLSYRLVNEDKYIYISQQMQVEDTGNGIVNEEELEDSVRIDSLNENAEIYRSPQDESLNCTIVYKNNVVFIMSNMELTEMKKIVSRIYYR